MPNIPHLPEKVTTFTKNGKLVMRNPEEGDGWAYVWALPDSHLNTDDVSLETTAQREVLEVYTGGRAHMHSR